MPLILVVGPALLITQLTLSLSIEKPLRLNPAQPALVGVGGGEVALGLAVGV